MSDTKEQLQRARIQFPPPEGVMESLRRRRDRKRRNQRIAAGVIGIAVFVAAIWIVTSVGSLDRSETSVVPGGDVTGTVETGPVETGPVETAPPPALASGAPDVVEQNECSDGASSRLELRDIGDRIKVRYEVHRSPPGDLWNIRMGHTRVDTCCGAGPFNTFWHGVRVASDSGALAVVRLHWDTGTYTFQATANDSATGERCWIVAMYP